MARNNDLAAALRDTREALGNEITELGRRLDDSRREVLDHLTTEVESLRADSRETRSRTSRTAAVAEESRETLSALRQEVSDVRQALAALQQSLDALARHPVFRTEPPATKEPPPFPPLQSLDDEEEPTGHEDDDEVTPDDLFDDDSDTGGTGPQHETTEDVDHGVLLLKAAQTGTVALVCHREAWEFVAGCAADNEHFRATAEVSDEGGGKVRAVLSGRSVIGTLIALRQTRDTRHLDGTWAMAGAFYSRIAEGLRTTVRDGNGPLTVVFDDGVHDTEPGTGAGPAEEGGA
ncbi:hypothetical protein ACH4OW_17240 [Streptomyces sp. NPDC017056]|uniref:hypothetical protein n=1 Tax=Streptomyces sp. NPDC017056 TaxID=3364973 RepID=UPI0037BDCBFC